MTTKNFDIEPTTRQWDPLFVGIVVTFAVQAAITTALGLIAIATHQEWIGETLLVPSFFITSGVGFCFLVRSCNPIEGLLIAVGYFPLMLIGYWFSSLLILLSLPGAQGNL